MLPRYWVRVWHVLQWLKTLDSREIYNQVINHLPGLELLTADSFKVLILHTHTHVCLNIKLQLYSKIYVHLWSFAGKTGSSSLAGQFHVWWEKSCLQRVQKATSFSPKRPHSGSLCPVRSGSSSVRPSVGLTECFLLRLAELTAQQTQSCVGPSTSIKLAWPSSKDWESTTLKSTTVRTVSSISSVCVWL